MQKLTALNQIFQMIPNFLICEATKEQKGKHHAKTFGDLAFVKTILLSVIQKTGSLRQTSETIDKLPGCGYHYGLQQVSKSTLSDALNNRPYQILETLYNRLKKFYPLPNRFKGELKSKVKAIDATTFELPLVRFAWAYFRETTSGVKVLTEMSINDGSASVVRMTEAKRHESHNVSEVFQIEPDTLYLFDRGFTNFPFWNKIAENNSTFITRQKSNLDYYRINSRTLSEEDKVNRIRSDQVIKLKNKKAKGLLLRRITVYDKEKGERIKIITNNFYLSASEIALLYKYRWEIELLFRTIKCILKIDHFLGSSKNAVLTQLFAALIYHFLLLVLHYQKYCEYSIGDMIKLIRTLWMSTQTLKEIFSRRKRMKSKVIKDMQLTLNL